MSVPVNKLCSKTLQVYVWCINAQAEECLVSIGYFFITLYLLMYSVVVISKSAGGAFFVL